MDGNRTLESFCMFEFSFWIYTEEEAQSMFLCIYSWERSLVMPISLEQQQQPFCKWALVSSAALLLLCSPFSFDHGIPTAVLFHSLFHLQNNSVPFFRWLLRPSLWFWWATEVTSILTALSLLPLGLDHQDHSQGSQALITELCKKENPWYWDYCWYHKIFWLLIARGPDPVSKLYADLPLALWVFYRQAAGDNQPRMSEMSNRSAQDYEWCILTCDFPHVTQTQPHCWSIAVVEGTRFSDPFPDFYDSG